MALKVLFTYDASFVLQINPENASLKANMLFCVTHKKCSKFEMALTSSYTHCSESILYEVKRVKDDSK